MRALVLALAASTVVAVAPALAQGLAPQQMTEDPSGWRYFPGGPAWNEYMMPPPYWGGAVAPPYYGPHPRRCLRINRWGEVRWRRWC
jgi:hypothetical protein